jgi:hypothetical protein
MMIGGTLVAVIGLFLASAYAESFFITNPNGHTVWKVGESVKISWNIIPGGPVVHSINLDLMSGHDGNATTLLNIATGLSPSSTSFDWVVPAAGIDSCLLNAVWVDDMMRKVGPNEWILPDEAWNKIGAQFPIHQLAFIKLTGVTDSFSTYVYNFSHRFVIKECGHHHKPTTSCSSKSSTSVTKSASSNASGATSAAGSVTGGANASNGSNATGGGAVQTGGSNNNSEGGEGNNTTEPATSSATLSTSTTRTTNGANNIKFDLSAVIVAISALALFL